MNGPGWHVSPRLLLASPAPPRRNHLSPQKHTCIVKRKKKEKKQIKQTKNTKRENKTKQIDRLACWGLGQPHNRSVIIIFNCVLFLLFPQTNISCVYHIWIYYIYLITKGKCFDCGTGREVASGRCGRDTWCRWRYIFQFIIINCVLFLDYIRICRQSACFDSALNKYI